MVGFACSMVRMCRMKAYCAAARRMSSSNPIWRKSISATRIFGVGLDHDKYTRWGIFFALVLRHTKSPSSSAGV